MHVKIKLFEYNTQEKLYTQSIIVDRMRFFLIVMIVFIHGIGNPAKSSMNINLMQSDPFSSDIFFNYFRLYISDTICRVAVPCFFIISGYYFFFKRFTNWRGYCNKLKKRAITLLIPFIVWNFIFLFYFYKNKLSSLTYEDLYMSFWSYKDTGCPIDYPLWYIRDLMLLCVISPFILFLSKFPKLLFLIWTWIVIFTGHKGSVEFPIAFLWFSLGAFFSLRNISLISILNDIKYGVFTVCLVLSFVCTYYFNRYTIIGLITFKLYLLLGVLSFFALSSSLFNSVKKTVFSRYLTASVFFIYAIHAQLLGMINYYLNRVVWNSIVDKYLLYIGTILLSVLMSLVLFAIFRKVVPNKFWFLLGIK